MKQNTKTQQNESNTRATGHVDELEAEGKMERLNNNNIVAQRCWLGSLVAWLEVAKASIRPADILSAEGESVCTPWRVEEVLL